MRARCRHADPDSFDVHVGSLEILAATALATGSVNPLRRLHLEKPLEALTVGAREMIRRLGCAKPPADTVHGFKR